MYLITLTNIQFQHIEKGTRCHLHVGIKHKLTFSSLVESL